MRDLVAKQQCDAGCANSGLSSPYVLKSTFQPVPSREITANSLRKSTPVLVNADEF